MTSRGAEKMNNDIVGIGVDDAVWELVVGEAAARAVGQAMSVEMVFRHIDADGNPRNKRSNSSRSINCRSERIE